MFSYTPPTDHHSSGTDSRQSGSARTAEAGAHRREGFTPLPNAVLLDAGLSRDARLLYALLQHHARGDGRCFPSHATLAAELGGGETALRAYLRELIDAGLVAQRRRGQGRTNMYILLPGNAGQQHRALPRTAESEAPEGDACAAPEPRQTEGLVPAQAEGEVAETAEADVPDAPESDTLERAEGADYEERGEGDTEIGNSKIRMLHRGSSEAVEAPANERTLAGATVPPNPPCPPNPRRDPRYLALEGPVTELCRELGDQAPPRTSLARTYNLLARSGLDPGGFLEVLEEARAITLAHQARITKRPAGDGAPGRRNMVPYCFAVLERLIETEQQPENRITVATAGEPDTVRGQAESGDPERSGEGTEPPGEAGALWRAVLGDVRDVLTPGNFARCRAGRALGLHGELLQIGLRTDLERHWFDSRVRRVLDEALARCGPAGIRLQFVVAAADAAG